MQVAKTVFFCGHPSLWTLHFHFIFVDQLLIVANKARIVSNRGSSAFALIRDDATVLTWGEPSRGGDSSSVEDQLINAPRLLRIVQKS